MKKTEASVAGDLSCWIMAGLFALGLIVLGVRLYDVQVSGVAGYNYANQRQSLRRVQTAGARGRILDRHGVLLADNRVSWSIVCHAAFFQRRSREDTVTSIRQALENVSKTIGLPVRVGTDAIRRHLNQSSALPLVAWYDVDWNALARFSEHGRMLPGFDCLESFARVYPQKRLASHVLGYVGRERVEAVAGDEKFSFHDLEMRGRSGLEVYYDSYLRGVPGEDQLLVDARGFTIRRWTVTAPQKGPDLTVSIDERIQREAERALLGERGACVVMDAQTGGILAMASSPDYDPNAFVPVLTHDLYARHADDPAKPLLNRACGGAYAPGSTFKPVTALAALSSGIPANQTYECIGAFELGGLHLRCTSRWGHGPLDLCHALMKSCNPYFCMLGQEIGTNRLLWAASALGLGSKTGLDFGLDMAGVLPDGQWKMKMYHEPWFPGDLPQMAIGQGMLLVSPLQMACVAGAIGTGFLVTPHFKTDLSYERRRLPFPDEALGTVRRGMRMVIVGDGNAHGTGRRGGENVAVPIAGKTGTAEIGRGERRRKNAWFIAYAPYETPTVSVAMVIENGEGGGVTAAPRVRNVLAAIFGEGGGFNGEKGSVSE